MISNKKLKGGKIKVKNLKEILKATYKNKNETPFSIDNYIYDIDMSTDEVKVYYNPNENQVVVAVRGTANMRDWGSDFLMGLRLTNLTRDARFTSARKVLDDAIKYYHKGFGYKVDVIGHSLGGKVAYEISRNSPNSVIDTSLRPEINNVIGFNSAGALGDSFLRSPSNVFNVRTHGDAVSEAIPQSYVDAQGNENDVIIPSPDIPAGGRATDYILQEHKIETLDRLPNQDMFIGSGISRKKLKTSHIQAVLFDINKWTSTNARKWLKDNNYNPIKKVHKTDNYYRYRITEPDETKYKYRFIKTNKNVDFILGIPKSK